MAPINSWRRQMFTVEHKSRPVRRRGAIASSMVGVALVLGSLTAQWTPVFAYGGQTLQATSGTDGSAYPRIIRLKHNGTYNGTLLASVEYDIASSPGSGLPVYSSSDNGATWTRISTVTCSACTDKVQLEPTLFEVPQSLGSGALSAGNILAAGIAVGTGTGTPKTVQVFVSTDRGSTWTYLSNCATLSAGQPGVWEPSFAIDASGELVCYFSSEAYQGSGYSQVSAQVISTDGARTWSAPTIDVGNQGTSRRPGMPTVVKVNDTYAMNIEGWCNGDTGPGCVSTSRDWVKTSSDGVSWGTPSDWGAPIQTSDGRYLSATPDLFWT